MGAELVANTQVAVDVGEGATLDVYAGCRLRSIHLSGSHSQQYQNV